MSRKRFNGWAEAGAPADILAEDNWLDDDGLLELARRVAVMPEDEPPTGIPEAVLRAVQPKRRSIWRQAWRWVAHPRTVTVSPLKLAPAMAALALLLVFAPMYLMRDRGPGHPVPANGGDRVQVVFTLEYQDAQSVHVIGSFNMWDPKGYPMVKDRDTGLWVLKVMLPKGRHEYSFLVNGQKSLADPKAAFSKDDGFGNKNSILIVENGWAV